MSCCEPYLQAFNEAVTSISYSALKSLYGRYPMVQIYYYDSMTGEYLIADNTTRVSFIPDTITIDHGGPAFGVVKIW